MFVFLLKIEEMFLCCTYIQNSNLPNKMPFIFEFIIGLTISWIILGLVLSCCTSGCRTVL